MKQAADNRRGVALIVVLGFLSIMVMMAVAFLTQARMERMVADSTLEAMRGRQIMRTALNAAMNDYSGTLWDEDKMVMPTEDFEVFISEPPVASVAMGGRTIGADDVELLVGEVEDWIPKKYRTLAVTNAVEDAEWILVRENPGSSSSRILGRYAYVCFDMSGGIDANLIGRAGDVGGYDARAGTNRVRRSVRQVPMRTLPEVLDAGKFQSYRSGWKGFDSLFSLIRLTDGIRNDGSSTASSARWQPERKEDYGAATTNVSDLTPYSMSAFRGGRYNQASATWTNPVLLGDSTDWNLALKPIISQFPSSLLPEWFNNAIYDYTHNNIVPHGGTEYPSPKNVPMFNEMAVSFKLNEARSATSSVYVADINIEFEFWYPFPSKDNNAETSFRITAPQLVAGPPNSIVGDKHLLFVMPPVAVMIGTNTSFFILKFSDSSPDPIPDSLTVSNKYNGGIPYTPRDDDSHTNFTYSMVIADSLGATNLPSGLPIRMTAINLKNSIYLASLAVGNADMIPAGLSFPAPPSLVAGGTAALAVTDPRLNHLEGQWVREDGGPTLAEINMANRLVGSDFYREGTNLYCRNGPMETPAELGFICTGAGEWETIGLCTDDAVNMLANLVTDTNLWVTAVGRLDRAWSSTNVFYTNGTINPNTRSSNVLMSAFIDLATFEVPNVYSNYNIKANPLDEDTIGGMDIVNTIVRDILEETEDGTFSTVFQAGTDWARIPCMRQGGALSRMDLDSSGIGFNNNQREALIRNTWGLFSPDDSLFTVVVIAQTIKEGPGNVGIWNASDDMVTGERRAVALVWRDPFKTGQNLHHEMYVRMFRHLND